jgi:hypothetical protein
MFQAYFNRPEKAKSVPILSEPLKQADAPVGIGPARGLPTLGNAERLDDSRDSSIKLASVGDNQARR